MGYYIDLGKISIEEYKVILRGSDLIPSWRILKQDLEKNFELISKCGIHDLGALKAVLKDKKDVNTFAKQSGVPEEYLVVLRRVINGFHPKPNRIKDFRGIAEEVVAKLEKIGIKNTRKLFPEIVTKAKRKALVEKTGIGSADILRLAKLTDVSRIRWVGHTFAYVLLESGYDTLEKVAKADYEQLYLKIKKLNNEREIYKGNIGLNDMKLCVEAAAMIESEVEY